MSGLLPYGPNIPDLWRRAADSVRTLPAVPRSIKRACFADASRSNTFERQSVQNFAVSPDLAIKASAISPISEHSNGVENP